MRLAIVAMLCLLTVSCSSGASPARHTATPVMMEAPSPQREPHPRFTGAELVADIGRAADVGVRATEDTTDLGCPDSTPYASNNVYAFVESGAAAFTLWEYPTAEERAETWTVSTDGTATPRADCALDDRAYAMENLILMPVAAGGDYDAIASAFRDLDRYIGVWGMRATSFPGAPLTGRELIWALEDVGLHFRPSDTGHGCQGLEGSAEDYEGLHGDPGFFYFSVWTYATPEDLEREWVVSSHGTATPKVRDCMPGSELYRNQNLILEFSFSTHRLHREVRRPDHDALRGRIVRAFLGMDTPPPEGAR